jgi:hypothetical protein
MRQLGERGGGAANRQQKQREQLNLAAETCASVLRLLSTQSLATSLCFHFTVLHCIAWMSVRREVYPFASLHMCERVGKRDPWRGHGPHTHTHSFVHQSKCITGALTLSHKTNEARISMVVTLKKYITKNA